MTREQISDDLNTAITALAILLDRQPSEAPPMPAVMVGAGWGVLARHIGDLYERIAELERRTGVT